MTRRRWRSSLHLIKIRQRRRFPVLEYLEVIARQSRHALAALVRHDDVDVRDADFDRLGDLGDQQCGEQRLSHHRAATRVLA